MILRSRTFHLERILLTTLFVLAFFVVASPRAQAGNIPLVSDDAYAGSHGGSGLDPEADMESFLTDLGLAVAETAATKMSTQNDPMS